MDPKAPWTSCVGFCPRQLVLWVQKPTTLTRQVSSTCATMAKNRNKKKQKQGAMSMDISEPTVSDLPQTMDISESGAQKLGFGGPSRKVKGRPMKRSKNVRKMKAMVKAIATNEKSVEKIMKSEDKASRILSAKLLYD